MGDVVFSYDFEKKYQEMLKLFEENNLGDGMCELLCLFPSDDVFVREFKKKKKTDASNFPEDIDQLETHVQDYYRFFSADWLVVYRRFAKYQQIKVDLENLKQKKKLDYEVDLMEKTITESTPNEKEIMPESDPLNFEYKKYNNKSDLINLLDCNLMNMFNPHFEHKSLAQHFGNLTHPSKIINPNSLKVFKQPAKIQFIVDTGKKKKKKSKKKISFFYFFFLKENPFLHLETWNLGFVLWLFTILLLERRSQKISTLIITILSNKDFWESTKTL